MILASLTGFLRVYPLTISGLKVFDTTLKHQILNIVLLFPTLYNSLCYCGMYCYCSRLTCEVQCGDSEFFRPHPLILLRFKVGQFRNFPTNGYIVKLDIPSAGKGKQQTPKTKNLRKIVLLN